MMIEHAGHATFIKPPLKLKAYLYAIGELPPRYPLPALADSNMVICLGYIDPHNREQLAWDGIWLDKVITVPFLLL